MAGNLKNDDGPSMVAIASWWQRRIVAMAGNLNRPLTPKELGQLKSLRGYLGIWTFYVLNWVWENWWQFAQEAQVNAGLSSAPAKPHIGFLLKHNHVAVGLMKLAAANSDPTKSEDIVFKNNLAHMLPYLDKKLEEHYKKLEEMGL